MFLTLFYMVATWIKSWQLRSIKTKLLEHISSESCVVFYKIPDDIQAQQFACSSLCNEPEKANISEILTINGSACACVLQPIKCLNLSTWKAPPPSPSRLAILPNVAKASLIDVNLPGPSISASLTSLNVVDEVNVLLECDLSRENIEEANILPEGDLWRLVAWKVGGSKLALALRGDIQRLAALASAFLYNDGPLTRLQTVKLEGTPTPLTESECLSVCNSIISSSPRNKMKYVASLEKISATPAKSTEVENISEPIEETLIVKKTDNVIEMEIKQDVKTSANENGSAIVAKKSDLRLDLNNTSHPEPSKVVAGCSKVRKKSVTKSLSKKSSSKTSLLDEPLTISDKKGVSLPNLPTVNSPNVVVYSDSSVTRENIARTLKNVLDPDRYVVYCTGDPGSLEAASSAKPSLLVAGGALPPKASSALLNALLSGAQVLSLCSDLLLTVLPYYRTAEVREKELVSFTYEKWKSVKLLHHVFCYQASPAKKQFNTSQSSQSTDYKGHSGHTLRVKVLAAEQTWHTPSLLQATDDKFGGTAVFSQVHLELDAREYLSTEGNSAEVARLGVLRKILNGLGLSTISSPLSSTIFSEPLYTPAYFLGTYERKLEAAKEVAVGQLKLVKPKEKAQTASSSLTPLLLHACPDNFSTVLYFQELRTEHFGRLAIYSDVLSSTQELIIEQKRAHGLVIVADRQTKGYGRSKTVWISPPGCLMFSLQVHSTLSDNFGPSRTPLLQQLTSIAIVTAVRHLPGYQDLDLRIKWPNDVYYKRSAKLGGLILNTSMMGNEIIFNIGVGINLDNSKPTVCLNDLIKKHNAKLPALEREKILALILNQLEKLFYDILRTGDYSEFYRLYYKYWLHSDEEVLVIDKENEVGTRVRIIGIDESGYLKALNLDKNKEIILHPDGNTFDMMKGLIAPKVLQNSD